MKERERRDSLRVIDLYSGFGGASQAFLDAGDWVRRVENNPLLKDVPNTIQMDVSDYTPYFEDIDLVIAAPPCLEFSLAYYAPRSVASRAGRTHFPDLGPLQVAVRKIEQWNPRYWVIENVAGARKYFAPYLGEPQNVGPFSLWGNIPQLTPSLGLRGHRKQDQDNRRSPLRSNYRAKWPLELSQLIRDSITARPLTLEDYE